MLTVRNLSKNYGRHQALRDVSFHAPDGQVFGLLGANGAGKTTLLRTVATLLQPTSGTAEVAGHDVRRDPEAVRRQIGVVNGGMGLYDRLSGRETLQYFGGFYGMDARATNARIEELDAMLDLKDTLDRRAGEYSTGMKQKIVIARAVIHDPCVLILDEAASGLDILARRALMDFVLQYRAPGRLVVFSTHVMAEVEELCEQVAIIDRGQLIALDSVQGLLARSGQPTLERAFFDLMTHGAAKVGA